MTAFITMSMITIGLVECFLELESSSLEFYLYQWQTIDQDSHIISIFITSLLSYLIRDLILIMASVFLIDKLDILRRPVISGQIIFISECFRFIKDSSFSQMIEDIIIFTI